MKHATVQLLLIAVSALFSGQSRAETQTSPTIHVDIKADESIVRIDNMQVEHNSLQSRGDRVYIKVASVPGVQSLRVNDKTIKLVEIIGGRNPRISVKLRHGRAKTEAIGLASTIENIDGGVVLHIPRWPIRNPAVVPVAKKPPREVAPTIKEPADTQEAVAATVEPAAEPVTKKNAPTTIVQTAEAVPAGKGKDEPGTSMGLILGFLLVMGGGAYYVWRMRQNTTGGISDAGHLRVIASKHLGGKAKVVWLSVAERQMLVAVNESNTSLLSEWNRNDTTPNPLANLPALNSNTPTMLGTPAAAPKESAATPITSIPSSKPSAAYDFQSTLEAATMLADRVVSQAPTKTSTNLNDFRKPLVKPSFKTPAAVKIPSAPVHNKVVKHGPSPAISGLMRLRDNVGTIQNSSVTPEVATNDKTADAEWARELLKATRDTMFRRAD